MLDDLSIAAAPFDATNAPVVLARNRVAVIGKHASPEDYPADDPLCAALLAFVRGGGTLLVFEQEHYPRALLPVSLTDQQASIAFARRAEDPLLQGVEEMDLAHWTVGGLVSARPMAKPDWGGFRTIVDSGGPEGLATAGLAELQMGRGRVLLCQLDVTRQYSVDPAATRIVRNLLPRGRPRGLRTQGSSPVIGGDVDAGAVRRGQGGLRHAPLGAGPRRAEPLPRGGALRPRDRDRSRRRRCAPTCTRAGTCCCTT